MKKVMTACVAFIISPSAFCQLNKGEWLVGGNVNFSYSAQSGTYNETNITNKITNLNGSIDGGYFIADKFCAGLRPALIISNNKVTSNQSAVFNSIYSSESKSTGLGVSPFMRYYFLSKHNKINVFADISYIYTYNKIKQSTFQSSVNPNTGFPLSSSSSYQAKDHTNAIAIEAGPAFFLNPKVSLELTVGYMYYQYSHLNSNSLTIGVSFHIYLQK